MIASTARRPRSAARWLAASALVLGVPSVASCAKEAPSGLAPPSSASASEQHARAAASAAPEREGAVGSGDEIRPVYPIDAQPPLPLAERYCNAVRETPRKRSEACCPGLPTFAPTSECIRTLSSALRSGAVTLAEADVDACAAAVEKETAGCDWVTSTGAPTLAACLGIIKGTAHEGALCRSNLECEDGMRCRRLGATRPGTCGPPLAAHAICNVATDSLAAFTGQDDMDRRHPECSGYCSRRQCHDPVAAGGACTASHECGSKGTCVAGVCTSGPAPGPGSACTDACAAGARCVQGTCIAVKASGEACERDVECHAHCARADGTKAGRCEGQCPSLPIASLKR